VPAQRGDTSKGCTPRGVWRLPRGRAVAARPRRWVWFDGRVTEQATPEVQAAAVEYARRRALIGSAFSPATPLTNKDLFAGRLDQLQRLLDVFNSSGRHAIMYGERGVGKTSLARLMHAILSTPSLSLYYTCSSAEDYGSIWRGVLGEARLTTQRPRPGFRDDIATTVVSAVELLEAANGSISPNDVRHVLATLSQNQPVVVFIDEFDRLTSRRPKTLFADTIKLLSDNAMPVTIVLVGVGDTVDDVIAEHASISRNLVQIPMPRMQDSEIQQIIEKGMDAAELGVDESFKANVVQLAQGLPHYAHLISQHAAFVTLESSRYDVIAGDFPAAIARALNDVSETIRDQYYKCTVSNRATIYREVLLACALATKDEIGTFGAPDVREKLREITGQNYDLPAFATHLRDFSGDGDRGGILKRREGAHPRYKFVDPLLPPYVVMRGQADGLL